MGSWGRMKTTLEIPDSVFRRAKASAAEQGVPLRQFVTDAVRERLDREASPEPKPWMKHAGKLKHLKAENARILKVIEAEFGTIDPEDWK